MIHVDYPLATISHLVGRRVKYKALISSFVSFQQNAESWFKRKDFLKVLVVSIAYKELS